MKTGAELEIQRKNNERSKEIDGKYNNPYSNYNQQNSNTVSTTTLEEDWRDLKGMFDFRSDEQKKNDQQKKKQLEIEENEKEWAIKDKLYDENFPILVAA